MDTTDGNTYAVLQFEREQLLYDISQICYIEGHVMPTKETEVHQRHTVQDVAEEGNVDRVTRVLDLCVSQCRELLYSYTKHRVRRKVYDDKLKKREAYAIVMKVPGNFSQTTLTLLERLIHEYLVARAVADWMSITNPAKEETWLAKAAEAESAMKTNLLARMGRTRRRLHPF